MNDKVLNDLKTSEKFLNGTNHVNGVHHDGISNGNTEINNTSYRNGSYGNRRNFRQQNGSYRRVPQNNSVRFDGSNKNFKGGYRNGRARY